MVLTNTTSITQTHRKTKISNIFSPLLIVFYLKVPNCVDYHKKTNFRRNTEKETGRMSLMKKGWASTHTHTHLLENLHPDCLGEFNNINSVCLVSLAVKDKLSIHIFLLGVRKTLPSVSRIF